MMKKIAFIADYGIPAIWYAMKQHIDMIIDAGFPVLIYHKKGNGEDLIPPKYHNMLVFYDDIKDLRHMLLHEEKVDYVWCPNFIIILKLGLNVASRKKLVYWVQGTVPDESFLRNRSRARWIALYILEKVAFFYTKKFVFVSQSMQKFYEHRHRLEVKGKEGVIVPCLSEFEGFDSQKERIPQSYVYIGGLSAWQCFNEMLDVYKKLETPNSVLHIITLDIEKAKKLVNAKFEHPYNIKIYSITDRKRIPEVLSQFQYGFLIRKRSPVNHVASPIKFLEYLSCGLNIIMTDAVPSYAKIVKEQGVGTVIDLNSDKIEINPYAKKASRLYNELFARDKFVDRYKALLSEG